MSGLSEKTLEGSRKVGRISKFDDVNLDLQDSLYQRGVIYGSVKIQVHQRIYSGSQHSKLKMAVTIAGQLVNGD